MRKLILALVLVLGAVTTVQASTTTIQASPTSSIVGQKVTFTATFTSSCAGTVFTHYFTVDGKTFSGNYTHSGLSGTETLSISTFAAGKHSVTYYWQVGGTICRGTASMSYTVALAPSPSPTPTPTPSPSPSPSPSPVTLVATKSGDTPLIGYLGGALIALTVVSGLALAVFGRR
jgi:hypothetical protein